MLGKVGEIYTGLICFVLLIGCHYQRLRRRSWAMSDYSWLPDAIFIIATLFIALGIVVLVKELGDAVGSEG